MAYRSPTKDALLLAAALVVAAAAMALVVVNEARNDLVLSLSVDVLHNTLLWFGLAVRVVLVAGLVALAVSLRHPRAKQLSLLAVAAILVVSAGTLPGPVLSDISQEARLVPPGNALARTRPEVAVLTMAPGGLRAVIFNYLWIRSQELHQQGKHHDAYQLARLICIMQPRFAGVWRFQSWQMAWNISVTCDTPEERWQWIYNGIKLLRDEGAEANPTDAGIYAQLAWTFLEKLGGDMDEMHVFYKQRWAKMMQDVLSQPPTETTAQALDAFAPLAAAPVDRDPNHRAGPDEGYIQADQLKRILLAKRHVPGKSEPVDSEYYVPKAADYVEKLNALGVKMDTSFLIEAYNRYSLDEGVTVARSGVERVKPPESDEKALALYTLVNDPNYAEARNRLVAFVRAQVLWNEYRMDPELMFRVMATNNIPLDWRLPIAHALYWVTHGKNATGFVQKADVATMHVDRMDMNALKDLTWYGRVVYRENPSNPNYPEIATFPDWRYMEVTHQRHIEMARQWQAAKARKGDPQPFEDNLYRDGHINYLISCVNTLYFLRRGRQARRYLAYIRDTYKPHGDQWQLPLQEFVYWQLTNSPALIPHRAKYQLSASLESALVSLALGDRKRYVQYASYARKVYSLYRQAIPERSRATLPPLDFLMAQQLNVMLVRPRAMGYTLPLSARINLYRDIEDVWTPAPGMPHPRVIVYDSAAPELKRLCEAADEPFDHAFPEPAGMKEYRARSRGPNLQLRGSPKP